MKQPAKLDFGHPPETIQFWKRLVREALSLSAPTPLYVCSALPIAERISELDAAFTGAGFQSAIGNPKSKIAFRHWLSCKTQPVAPLLRWWRGQRGDGQARPVRSWSSPGKTLSHELLTVTLGAHVTLGRQN